MFKESTFKKWYFYIGLGLFLGVVIANANTEHWRQEFAQQQKTTAVLNRTCAQIIDDHYLKNTEYSVDELNSCIPSQARIVSYWIGGK